MIRRPPRSTQSRSSAASDVYKRQSLSDEVLRWLPLRCADDSVDVLRIPGLFGTKGLVLVALLLLLSRWHVLMKGRLVLLFSMLFCVLFCMKETGALCTELSSMCEVDAVAPSRRPFMRPTASEIEVLLFSSWASKSKKKRQNNVGFFAQKRLTPCETFTTWGAGTRICGASLFVVLSIPPLLCWSPSGNINAAVLS